MVGVEAQVEQQLMPPARPRFIRVATDLETTSTFKIKKYKLQKEGAHPADIKDPIYGYHKAEGTYTKLTPSLYEDLLPFL